MRWVFPPISKNLGKKSSALLERFFSEKPKIYLDRLQSVIDEVAKKGDAVFFASISTHYDRVVLLK
jgi:hypothetical protein